MPSAGVYRTSPVFSSAAQLTMASMGALLFGSPPPRWMTGSPFSLSSAAVSFSFRVGDSLMDRASWLMLTEFPFRAMHILLALVTRLGVFTSILDNPRSNASEGTLSIAAFRMSRPAQSRSAMMKDRQCPRASSASTCSLSGKPSTPRAAPRFETYCSATGSSSLAAAAGAASVAASESWRVRSPSARKRWVSFHPRSCATAGGWRVTPSNT